MLCTVPNTQLSEESESEPAAVETPSVDSAELDSASDEPAPAVADTVTPADLTENLTEEENEVAFSLEKAEVVEQGM